MTSRGAFPPAVRALVEARSEGVCEGCGNGRATEIHHRRPRGMGGSRRPATAKASNALHFCGDCHRYAESNREIAVARGWIVLQSEDPASVPVTYRGHSLRIDDAGTPP
jgi:5-methylcytosine-specific restriction protein A